MFFGYVIVDGLHCRFALQQANEGGPHEQGEEQRGEEGAKGTESDVAQHVEHDAVTGQGVEQMVEHQRSPLSWGSSFSRWMECEAFTSTTAPVARPDSTPLVSMSSTLAKCLPCRCESC